MSTAEFGKAVRRWRDQFSPDTAGLATGRRRRASGLRREELAHLAGISVDYVTRLEQGRSCHPSTQVVESLARALRLSLPEREHLFELAGLAPPGPETVPAYITPSIHRLLDRLGETPVAVFDAACMLLVYNAPYAALMGDPSEWRGNERNGVWRHFLGLGSRVRYTPDEKVAFEIAVVSDLRAAAARYSADHQLHHMIRELRSHSARFSELWDSGAVGRHEAARKTVDHPQVGVLRLDCDVLTVAGSDLRIMMYTAEPGTVDAERLALVTTLGMQTLAV
ncbi:helix-turn-helix transcriptional regulator [Streptomyces sp. NPDC002159]